MEKLIYLVWKSPEVAAEAFRERMLGELAERLVSEGARGLAMNLIDEHAVRAQKLRITRSPDPIAGTISVWLDTALGRGPVEAAIAGATSRQAGYLVLESVPLVNTSQHARPGERTPGIQTVALIERKRGMDYEAWREQWQGQHTRVGIETQSTFQYIQNVVFRRLHEDAPPWAAIVEEGFPAEAVTDPMVFYAADGSEQRLRENRRRMMESCAKFIDFDSLESHPLSEYVLVR